MAVTLEQLEALDIHEVGTVETGLEVMRVPGGFIYIKTDTQTGVSISVDTEFVPYFNTTKIND